MVDGAQRLYHYTAAAGAIGIAATKVLWATNIRFLNDSTEYLHALHLAKRARDERASSLSAQEHAFLSHAFGDTPIQASNAVWRHGTPYYVVSLTSEPDLLSQWRAYAPRGGYSLGWTADFLGAAAAAHGFSLQRCIYDDEEQQRLVDQVLNTTIEEFRSDAPPLDLTEPFVKGQRPDLVRYNALLSAFDLRLGRIATICKNPAFAEEKEWRLVSSRTPWAPESQIKYRAAHGVVVPYIELPLLLDPTLQINREIHVLCGPSPDIALSQFAALHLFASSGWSAVSSSVSLVPYRDW